MNSMKLLLSAIAVSAMAGCSSPGKTVTGRSLEAPQLAQSTQSQERLRALPAAREKIAITVYGFNDLTGQFKPSEGVQSLSRAVSQGGTSILVKALQDAGNRTWFTVLERENLDNLLQERQIIREMRRQYLGEEQIDADALPPMLFAGILLEGGVIGYDTNTLTGGEGARFLGIGASHQYREDTITVYLRAISVKTGEVITSVSATKKVASVGIAANAFRYVSFKELLEIDTGITSNEPQLLALRQAVEAAVEYLILDGAELGVWTFQNPQEAAAAIERYRMVRDAIVPSDMVDESIMANANEFESQAVRTSKSRQATNRTRERNEEIVPASIEATSAPDLAPVAMNDGVGTRG